MHSPRASSFSLKVSQLLVLPGGLSTCSREKVLHAKERTRVPSLNTYKGFWCVLNNKTWGGGKMFTLYLGQMRHTETSSLRTRKIMHRNLNKIVRSWIRLQDSQQGQFTTMSGPIDIPSVVSVFAPEILWRKFSKTADTLLLCTASIGLTYDPIFAIYLQ